MAGGQQAPLQPARTMRSNGSDARDQNAARTAAHVIPAVLLRTTARKL